MKYVAEQGTQIDGDNLLTTGSRTEICCLPPYKKRILPFSIHSNGGHCRTTWARHKIAKFSAELICHRSGSRISFSQIMDQEGLSEFQSECC